MANLISVGRLLAGVPAVWLILAGRFDAAFWLFLAAGLSDALDGFIAKYFNSRTSLGALLDPLADKVLLTSVFLVLGYQGLLPPWLIALIILRDGLIVSGATYLWLRRDLGIVRPLLLGKLCTVAQIVLAAAVLAAAGDLVDLGAIIDGLVYATAALTLLSGLNYLRLALGALLTLGRAS